MGIGLRLGTRSFIVLLFGIPAVVWQSFQTQSPQFLVVGLAGVAVLAFLFSIHLIVRRPPKPPLNARPNAALPRHTPSDVGWSAQQMTAASASQDEPPIPPAATPLKPPSVAATVAALEAQALVVPVRRPLTEPLRALIDLYRDRIEVIFLHPTPAEQEWIRLGPELKHTLTAEFDKIRPYMDEVVAKTRPGGLLQLQHDVNGAALFLSTGAWCAGRAAALGNPHLRESLADVNAEDIAALPRDFRGAVEDAIDFAHWVFVSVFHSYYASSYGAAVRDQRDGHYMDLYRAFTRVGVLCYLAGVRSV